MRLLIPAFGVELALIVEFNIRFIQTFEWNNEAYDNLVIPPEQKTVLTTLVEAHTSEPAAKLDDFVRGKGLGLVINLYGNPGTGKRCMLLRPIDRSPMFYCRKESDCGSYERTSVLNLKCHYLNRL